MTRGCGFAALPGLEKPGWEGYLVSVRIGDSGRAGQQL